MYIFQQKKEDKVIDGGSERSEPLVVFYYLQRERHFVFHSVWTCKYGGNLWDLIIRYFIVSCEYTIVYNIVSFDDTMVMSKISLGFITKCCLMSI